MLHHINKKLFLVTVLCSLVIPAYSAETEKKDEPKMKEVCKTAKGKDGKVLKNKDGSDQQKCKTIKIHKKYEGKQANVKENK